MSKSKPEMWWCVKSYHGLYVWTTRCTKSEAKKAFESGFQRNMIKGEESVVRIRVEEVKPNP